MSRLGTLRRAFLPAVVAAALTSGCADEPLGPAEPITQLPRALSPSESLLIEVGNDFAVDLLRQIHAAMPDSTVFISPLSASMALGMTMNGGAGTTRDQMGAMLGFGAMPLPEINASYEQLIELLRDLDPRVDFRLANAIFHRGDIRMEAPFLSVVRDHFDAEVAGLDFTRDASAEVINRWASRATAGRIDHVVDPPISDVIAFLINAVYFKGDWVNGFDPSETRSAPFRLPNGESRPVRMMKNRSTLPIRRGEGWVAVELPYGGGPWAMTVAVPTDDRGLTAVMDDLETILDPAARWGAGYVEVHLPRFELEWDRKLNADLMALGMVDAFVAGRADFTPMLWNARDIGLYIDRVTQNSFLRVDEEGSEAAAVTVVVAVPISTTINPLQVRADRPFLLAIRERLSGTVAFVGLIAEAPVD
jgi:serpin B